MSNPSRAPHRLTVFTQAAGIASAGVGCLVLVGWALDVHVLKSVLPGELTMKANTALGFILLGVSLWLLRAERADRGTRLVGRACASFAALIGLLTLGEYVLGWNPGVDQLLFHDAPQAANTSNPGRMSALSALNFLLIGSSLVVLDLKTRRGWLLGQLLVGVAAVISGLVLAGYALDFRDLYSFGLASATTTAIHTAPTFLILCAGVFCARPDRGFVAMVTSETPGGLVARRLFLAALGIPLVLGFLTVQGERVGFYDAGLGWPLFVLLVILALAPLLALTAKSLDRADAELRRAEEVARRAAAIVEASDDAIVGTTLDGTITSWNPGAERLYGYSADEAVGQPVSILVPQHHLDEERQILRTVRAGKSVTNNETEQLRKDGSLFDISFSVSPIKDAGGTIVGGSRIGHDISEVKQAREETNRLRDEFFSLVSHDLRTPLTSIRGYLELLLEGEVGEPTGEVRHFLEVIARNTARLERLVSDLLFVAQVETGEFALEVGIVDLGELVAECVEGARPRAAEKEVDLTFKTDSVTKCRGDRDRLAQLFDNLLSNALKYTPEGGRVEIRLQSENSHLLLEVEDSGVGIPAADQERIFERFFRAAGATERGIPGVGLGLTIVKAIAEGHGGRVGIESEEGAGTTFRVELPLHEFLRGEKAKSKTARSKKKVAS